MSVGLALIVMCIILLIYPFISIAQVLQNFSNGAIEQSVKYIVIYLVIAAIFGILASFLGGTIRNRVSKFFGTVFALMGVGYYLFGYLVPQICINGATIAVAVDCIIVLSILIVIYSFGLPFVLFSDTETCIIPLIFGIIVFFVIYMVLHLDVNDFQEYRQSIPDIYGTNFITEWIASLPY